MFLAGIPPIVCIKRGKKMIFFIEKKEEKKETQFACEILKKVCMKIKNRLTFGLKIKKDAEKERETFVQIIW
jgi:hypothetical protein